MNYWWTLPEYLVVGSSSDSVARLTQTHIHIHMHIHNVHMQQLGACISHGI